VTRKSKAQEVYSTAVLEKEALCRPPGGPGKESVLVVDDEEGVTSAVSEFLSMRGFEVQVALNSRQALGIIHNAPFSIVISDLRLPDMNGVDLLGHVLDADPDTVFIIMTGYASVQSAVESLKRGAYDYVVKPFSLYELEKTVKLGLEKRRLAKENLELSHLARKLIEVDQIKSNIMSTVSHEFRTPLMSLKGYLSMLTSLPREEDASREARQAWLHAMKDNLGRLEMLILNLLLMTEANSGDLLIAEEDVSVELVIGESVSRLAALTKTKEVSIELKHVEDVKIRGDAEKLGVALANMIENAVKFNLESGKVEIGVARTSDPDGVRVSIIDTGIGIPEEKIPKIFESFTQADMTHTRRFGGAGLGLPVAKAIVEAHGGNIGVNSQPGVGSAFHVWLPRVHGV
jgi:signal transduction histidine kinase